MEEVKYGYTKRLEGASFASAEERIAAALKTEGFGVLTEIDVRQTLAEKLGEEIRPYKILGACNPPLARRAIGEEPAIGLLLPCNVVIREGDGGEVVVHIGKPLVMFEPVDNPGARELAADVDARMRRVLEAI